MSETVNNAVEPVDNKYDYKEKTVDGSTHAASNFGKFVNYGPDCPGNNGAEFGTRENLKSNNDLFKTSHSDNPGGDFNNCCFKPGEAVKGGGAKLSVP